MIISSWYPGLHSCICCSRSNPAHSSCTLLLILPRAHDIQNMFGSLHIIVSARGRIAQSLVSDQQITHALLSIRSFVNIGMVFQCELFKCSFDGAGGCV